MKAFMQEKNILDSSETFVSGALDSAKVEDIISTSTDVQKENNTTFVQDGVLTVNTGTARWEKSPVKMIPFGPGHTAYTRRRCSVIVATATC